MAKIKSEEPTPPVELMDVFTPGDDGRLKCNFCTYDTQLSNKARNHTIAVHETVLKPVQTIVKKRGVIPQTLITEILEVPSADGQGE